MIERERTSKRQSFLSLFRQADERAGIFRDVPVRTSSEYSQEEEEELEGREAVLYGDETKPFKEDIVRLLVPADSRDWSRKLVSFKRKTTTGQEHLSLSKLRKLVTLVDWEDDVFALNHQEASHVCLATQRKAFGAVQLNWEAAVEWDREEVDYSMLGRVPGSDELGKLVKPDFAVLDAYGDQDAVATTADDPFQADRSRGEVAVDEEISASIEIEAQEVIPLSKAQRELLELKNKVERLSRVSTDLNVAALYSNKAKAKEAAIEESLGNKMTRKVIVLEHTQHAERNRNCRADLQKIELKHFHRPRLSQRNRRNPWEIVFPKLQQKTASKHKRGKAAQNIENISLVEGEFMVLEYVEEYPPILMNMGMASKILNYYRTIDDQSRSAVQSAYEKSVRDTFQNMDQQNQRVPQHVRLLVEKQTKKIVLESDTTLPKFPLGKLEILGNNDEFPFLGSLEKGESQPTICTNMFCAPIFRQKCVSNDFLLILTKIKQQDPPVIIFTLREIENIYVCGQVEPSHKVPKPMAFKRVMTSREKDLENFILMHLVRNFFDGVKIEAMMDKFRTSMSLGKTAFSEPNLKRFMRLFANEIDDRYYRRDFFKNKHLSHLEAAEEARRYSIEELEASIRPETVCLQESCNANEYRLVTVGITDIELPKLELWFLRMVEILKTYEKRLRDLVRVSTSVEDLESRFKLRKLCLIVEQRTKLIRHKVDRGHYIFCRLANASWNTTEAYVDAIGNANLEIDHKVVDPSGGLGEAFAYIKKQRCVQTSQRSKMKTIESTSSDLRKIEIGDLRNNLVDMGIPRGDLEGLGRWDLVHLFRENANKARETGVGIESIGKFARDAKVSGFVKLQCYKEACKKVRRKQIEALSKLPSDDSLSDSDESDDENFVAKLRKEQESTTFSASLIGAEEEKEVDQLEELKQILLAPDGEIVKPQSSDDLSEPTRVFGPSWVRPTKVVKRIVRHIQQDGAECTTVSYIIAPEEVARVQNAAKRVIRRQQESQQQKQPAVLVEKKYNGSDFSGMKINFRGIYDKVEKLAKERSEKGNVGERAVRAAKLAASQSCTISNRHPKVELNARLEKIIVDMWTLPKALPFRFPPNEIPGYLALISDPICLLDIRKKLGRFQYVTIAEFKSDMELLAKNALLYNGRESPYSADAASLLQSAIEQTSTDTLKELEETVARRISLLYPDNLQYQEQVVKMQEECEPQIHSSSEKEVIAASPRELVSIVESSAASESAMELA